MPRWWAWVGRAVGVAVGYGVAVQVGLMLKPSDAEVAYFWPAGGVGVAAMIWGLRRSAGCAYAAAAGLVLANVVLNAVAGPPAELIVGFTVANCAESVVVGAVFIRIRRRWTTARMGMTALLMAGWAGVSVSTGLAVVLLSGTGLPLWQLALNWAVPDLAGVVVVGALILGPHRPPRGRRWEAAGQMLALSGVCSVVDGLTSGLPVAWAPLPLLVWSAMRLGTTWTAIGTCLVAATSSIAAAHALGPFGADGHWTAMLAGQAFATVVAFTAMSLAIVADDREQIARTLIFQDPLTGLANRRLFTQQLNRVARDGARRTVAVLYCDLDAFKAVNDTYGHHAGDMILISAARRLSRAVRPSDLVARLGGDEFAVLCHGLADAAEAEAIRGRILNLFEVPIVDDQDRTHCVGISVGIASLSRHLGTEGHRDPCDLLHEADHDMYRTKAGRRASPRQV